VETRANGIENQSKQETKGKRKHSRMAKSNPLEGEENTVIYLQRHIKKLANTSQRSFA
jgi:hypothetical protein